MSKLGGIDMKEGTDRQAHFFVNPLTTINSAGPLSTTEGLLGAPHGDLSSFISYHQATWLLRGHQACEKNRYQRDTKDSLERGLTKRSASCRNMLSKGMWTCDRGSGDALKFGDKGPQLRAHRFEFALPRNAGPQQHLTLATGFSTRARCRMKRHKVRKTIQYVRDAVLAVNGVHGAGRAILDSTIGRTSPGPEALSMRATLTVPENITFACGPEQKMTALTGDACCLSRGSMFVTGDESAPKLPVPQPGMERYPSGYRLGKDKRLRCRKYWKTSWRKASRTGRSDLGPDFMTLSMSEKVSTSMCNRIGMGVGTKKTPQEIIIIPEETACHSQKYTKRLRSRHCDVRWTMTWDFFVLAAYVTSDGFNGSRSLARKLTSMEMARRILVSGCGRWNNGPQGKNKPRSTKSHPCKRKLFQVDHELEVELMVRHDGTGPFGYRMGQLWGIAVSTCRGLTR
ncbi:hypothetical protein EI94DRAFT_1786087 [Lactarius quietus]|nr:hypothetical protein EI94DRAFT_1786087 [Lactarius quietus]